jgi:hypothetical protein
MEKHCRLRTVNKCKIFINKAFVLILYLRIYLYFYGKTYSKFYKSLTFTAQSECKDSFEQPPLSEIVSILFHLSSTLQNKSS